MIVNTTQDRAVTISTAQRGFTLVEVMIVVAILGVLAAIAYPNYQRYVIKSKRTDMMSEMHNIAAEIQSRKLIQGSYSNALITGLGGDFPKQGTALYAITFTPNPLTSEWRIIATPKASTQMTTDGILSLNYQGTKCRNSVCGTGNDWND
ncbi:type IV pilin protein [Psychrobacter sp. DAB_AL43B]|uniref:type IV pilin protein n=1 Tax=Psychrobacter sp. DAB_AL43B TaxID=1028416 RepID=UPI0009A5FE28|nr:prepilin-type N-terminal cleavage/methylation domain-containing protein [Psychrobacter sp. DAB_AL43B]SLJ83534.1 pilus assembly protein PilE [Psychrobacter sp. DAB_AL43B]